MTIKTNIYHHTTVKHFESVLQSPQADTQMLAHLPMDFDLDHLMAQRALSPFPLTSIKRLTPAPFSQELSKLRIAPLTPHFVNGIPTTGTTTHVRC